MSEEGLATDRSKVQGVVDEVGGAGSMAAPGACSCRSSSSSLPWQKQSVRRATETQRKLNEEVGEKLEGVTRRSPACLGKSEEDRSGRISPETGDEEVDVVVAVVVPSSIP
jgi:hypothetical protein